MILVDVHALQLGEVYDFEVDEDKTADELLGDIVSLICKKENKKQKKEGNYYLYALPRFKIHKAYIYLYNLYG